MESKNRNVWIVVIAVLVIACCCALALAAGAVGWLTSRYADIEGEPFDLGALQRERVEETFEVGDAPTLEITNFAGSVSIQPGEGNVIHVVATKKASSQSRLDRIEVNMSEANGRVMIKTRNSLSTGNASVELEITAPAGSRVSVDTGAGEVDVRGITGSLDIHSGAGTVGVRGAQGTTRVDLGAGQITYEGSPSGECRFQTGAGEIILRLPESPNVRIDVGTGLGAVDVDFDLNGQVSPRSANGVIGDGRQGTIYAHTGIGSVSVRRQ
jgi:DUF4097 and DUF4098 domain-containing protein YvlB